MNHTLKTVVLALSLLGPASAFAGPSEGGRPAGEHRGRRGGEHFLRVVTDHAKELGISDATLSSMKAAFEAARPEVERLHQQLRDAHQSGDEARIEAARTAMRQRHEALRAQVDGLLTEKQRAALKDLMHKEHPRHGDRKGAPPA